MDSRFYLERQADSTWLVSGVPHDNPVRFTELAAALDYAKRQCGAAPAVIEVLSDGLYVAAFQEEGWPHHLCQPTLNFRKIVWHSATAMGRTALTWLNARRRHPTTSINKLLG